MSTNRNRAKLYKATNGREYRIILMKYEWDYCHICSKRCGSYYYSCSPADLHSKHRHGTGKPIYSFKYRSYKTWKHSRKTQWKE